MYFRVKILPNDEREKFRSFYETYIGDEELREDLGESYEQASEFGTYPTDKTDFPTRIKENLEKIKYFYSEDDSRKRAIERYLTASQLNPTLCNREYLDKFFNDELQLFLDVSFHIFKKKS